MLRRAGVGVADKKEYATTKKKYNPIDFFWGLGAISPAAPPYRRSDR
jgi:hypothetical protein